MALTLTRMKMISWGMMASRLFRWTISATAMQPRVRIRLTMVGSTMMMAIWIWTEETCGSSKLLTSLRSYAVKAIDLLFTPSIPITSG